MSQDKQSQPRRITRTPNDTKWTHPVTRAEYTHTLINDHGGSLPVRRLGDMIETIQLKDEGNRPQMVIVTIWVMYCGNGGEAILADVRERDLIRGTHDDPTDWSKVKTDALVEVTIGGKVDHLHFSHYGALVCMYAEGRTRAKAVAHRNATGAPDLELIGLPEHMVRLVSE